MKYFLTSILLLSSVFCSAEKYGYVAPDPIVTKTTCEFSINPQTVTNPFPRFGWQMSTEASSKSQSAFHLIVTTENGEKVWDTGKTKSGSSQLVRYDGKTLTPGETYTWKVKVWNQDGKPYEWSAPATFTMAPVTDSFGADWIGAISYEDARLPEGRNYTADKWKKTEIKEKWDAVDTLAHRSIMLRKDFNAPSKPVKATAHVCGLGHYEFELNGKKVGDGEFTPLWSDYDKTVYYNTYDVTPLLNAGENAMGVTLGNGFYNVVRGNRYSKLQVGFGPETLWMAVVLKYEDGSCDTLRTDKSWKYDLSPITFHSIYGGEDYDARLEQNGWSSPGFNDSAWKNVVVQRAPKGKLTPQHAPDVKIMERFGVKSKHKLTAAEIESASKSTKRTVDKSAFLLDIGQNLAGFPAIKVRGKRGQKITLVVGESITDENAASQRQTGRQHLYTYTLKGDKVEEWHPKFSYYGFRYIQVEGAVMKGDKNPDKLPVIDDVKSCFVYNSAPETSTFECSSPVYNAAHKLIRNAVRSNMQSVFTDCPHREKLGWLEQVHLNGPGLLYNYDLTTYLPKVMRDIADSSRPDGAVPTVAPQYVVFEGPGMDVFSESPEWGATLIMSPWQYYETYGDDSLLFEFYPEMKRYADYLESRADKDGLIDFGLGDWYDYGDFKAGFSRNTPVGLVASAHYYQDLIHLEKIAKHVGNYFDAKTFETRAERMKDAFNRKYLDISKISYGSGSQCSNALPIFLNMVPTEYQQGVLDALVADIKAHGNRLTTGDVGNRYLFRALSDNGLDSLMWAMTDHYDLPGYGYQLNFGATTLTEQWDPRQGSSWNHFMMGQIDEWLFRSLLGIRPDPNKPGYKHLIIEPKFIDGISYAKGSIETLYGIVYVDWERNNDFFTIMVQLPFNTSATVIYPDGEKSEFTSGSHAQSIELVNGKIKQN